MHMADALISPIVGGLMWTASLVGIAYCSKKVKDDLDDKKVPLMGVIGAFIFAAQMINFTIPATGSSGHLGGGMILAILLGPYAAFLTMASVLIVQALFFADGGLLALGCNIFNLGFFPCFIAYPLIFKKMVGKQPSLNRIMTASVIAAVIGLQLGSLGVVFETFFSGISELPLDTFIIVMQPIHLAIGIVEGMVTATVVVFIWQARPDLIDTATETSSEKNLPMKNVLAILLSITIVTGCGLSWFASSSPDGLEWAMFKTAGVEELEKPENTIYSSLEALQEKTAFLPDYGFKEGAEEVNSESEIHESWPSVNAGTSFSGLVGGLLTLVIALLIGLGLKKLRNPSLS